MRYVMCMMLVAACGSASSEVKMARTAEYDAPLGQLFDAALDEAQAEYTIGEVDPANGRFATKPEFYKSDGTHLSEGQEGVAQHVEGKDVSTDESAHLMHLVVQVKRAPSSDHMVVVVSPRTFEILRGSPKPRELALDDPSLPPWVKGRVDKLAVRIYQRLSPLAAKGGSAQAAGAAPAPATPAPAAPEPAPQAP